MNNIIKGDITVSELKYVLLPMFDELLLLIDKITERYNLKWVEKEV